MPHHLILHAAILMSGGWNTERLAMDLNPDFEVTAACRGGTHCIFDHGDVYFDITIKNVSGSAIRFPLQFIDHSGPYVILHDNRRNRSEIVPSSMRNEKLLANLTVLEPGQSVSIAGLIHEAQLEKWGGPLADVTAEIKISAPLDQSLKFRLIGLTQLRIVGREVADGLSRTRQTLPPR